ncbi:MAG: glycine cleavage system protein H [Candidatus Heimdallarchaeota archaeon]|nr:glycine cleavage system protein H [Candidatus Heimdallarchaeota archaeon]MCK5049403.1 glycine cleavage system protein H [Candidatus Heimdallarchaeota archaeon]
MDVNDLDLPEDISYIDKILWVKRDYEEDSYSIGITDFAQRILGDIISIYFTESEEFDEGDEFFTVTSIEDELVVKSPFPCNIVEENSEIKLNPEELNEEPYVGWIFKITLEDDDDFFDLLDREEILDQIQAWITENPELKINPTAKKKTNHRKKLAQLVKEDNIERILEDDPYAIIPEDDAHDPFEAGSEEKEDDEW